jgi:hypothetical protein
MPGKRRIIRRGGPREIHAAFSFVWQRTPLPIRDLLHRARIEVRCTAPGPFYTEAGWLFVPEDRLLVVRSTNHRSIRLGIGEAVAFAAAQPGGAFATDATAYQIHVAEIQGAVPSKTEALAYFALSYADHPQTDDEVTYKIIENLREAGTWPVGMLAVPNAHMKKQRI